MESSNAEEETSNLQAKAVGSIQQLDKDYEKLRNAESILIKELEKIQADEALLRTALAESKETGRHKLARQKKENNDDAIRNLQAALMVDDDDESSSNSGDSIDAHSYEQQKLRNDSDIAIGMIDASSDDEVDEEAMLQGHHI